MPLTRSRRYIDLREAMNLSQAEDEAGGPSLEVDVTGEDVWDDGGHDVFGQWSQEQIATRQQELQDLLDEYQVL